VNIKEELSLEVKICMFSKMCFIPAEKINTKALPKTVIGPLNASSYPS